MFEPMKDMTVGQLLKELKKYPKTSVIVMASDEEGNSMNTLGSIEPMRIVGEESFAVDPNQPETYDRDNPGGNAVYFLAFSPVEREEEE
jgi:hypothetical protein